MSFSWKEVGSALASAAPAIGTLLGGPAGAAIGTIIAAVVKVDDTPESVAEAIHTSPAAVRHIQAMEGDKDMLKKMNAMDVHALSVEVSQKRIQQHLTEALVWVNETPEQKA